MQLDVAGHHYGVTVKPAVLHKKLVISRSFCQMQSFVHCRRRFQRTLRGVAGGQHFGKPIAPHNIVASEAVFEFQYLSHSQQSKVAQSCDSNKETILTALAQLAAVNVFF